MADETIQAADQASARTISAGRDAAQITVYLINESRLARNGTRAILATCPEFTLTGEAESPAKALESGAEPNVYLVETPTLNRDIVAGIGALVQRGRGTHIPALILTTSATDFALDLLRIGVCALDSRSLGVDELVSTLRLVSGGYIPIERRLAERLANTAVRIDDHDVESRLADVLTPRERDVYRLLALGMSNAEIAERLTVATSTIKSYVKDILSKLGLRNRSQLIIYAHAQTPAVSAVRVR